MTTTIQVSEELQGKLNKRKLVDRETYEEVIWDLLEDTMELNEETKRDLAKSRAEIKAGKIHSFAEVKKKCGLR